MGPEIFIQNGDTLVSSYGGDLYGRETLPPNGSTVKSLMDDLRKKCEIRLIRQMSC